MRCGPTRATTRSARPTTSPARMYNSLQLSWNRRFAHGFAFGAGVHALEEHGRRLRTSATSFPTPTMRTTCGASRTSTSRHILIINYLYELPFFREPEQSGRQDSRRLADQRHHAVPDRHHLRASAAGNDYAGVGQDGSMSTAAASSGSLNGTPNIVARHRAQRRRAMPNYWFSTKDSQRQPDCSPQPAKGTFNTQAGVRNILHNPGFQNWNIGLFKKFAIKEKDRLPVPCGGVQRLQSPELGRRQLQPDQPVHLRQDHRQDRRRTQHAALAPLLLLEV